MPTGDRGDFPNILPASLRDEADFFQPYSIINLYMLRVTWQTIQESKLGFMKKQVTKHLPPFPMEIK